MGIDKTPTLIIKVTRMIVYQGNLRQNLHHEIMEIFISVYYYLFKVGFECVRYWRTNIVPSQTCLPKTTFKSS